MSEPRRCPQCDAEIPVNSPAGLCPRCLLKASTDSQSEKWEGKAPAEPGPTKLTPPASGFIPPTVEELAPLFPQLEILELLGKGGMGAVYKARQPGLDRLVAIKILPSEISRDPTFAERFQREARALARLSHPHIVAVYDFGQAFVPPLVVPPLGGSQREQPAAMNTPPEGGTTNGLCYIVMEFVDGANLRQAIKAGKLTSSEALAIVPQICEALQFAHDEGIVHRDIKPENILIDKRGRVKIADFGLAKLLGQDASDHSLTATHQVMGTLRYMAPEQMQGSREVDHRADIYSLGVVFYELLTGELPMGRFAPPSKRVQVDVRLDEIVLRALEQQPEQRYQHASEVKTDVEAVVRGEPMMSSTTNRADRPSFEPVKDTFESHTKNPLTESRLVQGPADCLLLAAGIAFVTAFGVTLWLLGVPASSSNPATTSLIRGNLIVMSATLAIYSVFVGIAGLMMRRLQARLFVLLVNVIVGLFLPAVIALNVVMELRNIPVWPVAIPFWIGVPAALWVVVRLFRDDVRGAFNAAAEQRKLRGFSNPSQQPPKSVDEPRFSRFAIAGTVWALFGLLAIIPTLYFIGLNRVWNGTALPTDIIYEAPPLAFTIFMGTLLAIGAGAPIGTTIYGAISIGHIKRSGGKIVGLPLAVVDVLFFPLLVVFAGIAVPVSLVLHSLLPLQMIAVAVPSAMFALIVCLAIGFAVWRKVIPSSALTAITLREKLRLAGIALLIAGIMDALSGLVWIGHNASNLVVVLKQGTPIGWQVASMCLSLGSLWIVYYVVGVALHLMTLEDDGDFTFCLLTAAIAPPGCLIGLPAAIYAMVQLSKPEVKALIPKKSSEPQASTPTNEITPGVESVATEPRLSRCALVGAIWSPLFFIAACASMISTRHTTGEYTGPAWWQLALAFTLLPLGVLAPFGTTILGAVAIAKIKRSDGKLYGLRLAQVDVLLFPLLILGFAAAALTHIVQIVVWTKTHTGYAYKADILADIIAPNPANRPDMIFLILDLLVAQVVCFFAGLAAWRKITGQPAPVTSPVRDGKSAVVSSEPRLSRLAVIGLILVAIGTPIALFDLCAVVDVLVIPTALGHPIATKGPIHTFGHEIRDSIVFSLATLFVAAILSGFAINQIKRSDGKLYGLRLAVANMLIFPMFMLAALVAVPLGMLLVVPHAGLLGPVASAVVGILACVFAGRTVWRAILGHDKHTVEKPGPDSSRRVDRAADTKPPETMVAQESLPYLLGWLVHWLLQERWFVAILQTATALIYAACLIAFFSFQSTNTQTPAGSLTKFQVGQPSAWLTLEASKTGQHASLEFLTRTHFVALFGLVSLAVYRWLERRQAGKAHSMILHYFVWGIFLAGAVGFGLFTLWPRLNS